jgi:uncharacterized protein (DUF3820 family)
MINHTLKFGKYKGMSVRDVMTTKEGRQYLLWLADKGIVKKDLKRLIYTLIHQ